MGTAGLFRLILVLVGSRSRARSLGGLGVPLLEILRAQSQRVGLHLLPDGLELGLIGGIDHLPAGLLHDGARGVLDHLHVAGLIPGYLNCKMLGLTNTFWIYVIPGIFPVYNMVLIKTYMESISPALEESAEIDGAGYFVRFTRIVMPLCVPILATVVLFSAVGHWNSYMDTLIYVTDYKLYTLQYLLYEYINQAKNLATQIAQGSLGVSEIDPSRVVSPTSVQLTVTIVVIFPIICVYPFLQRYYVKGIMIGAVKG